MVARDLLDEYPIHRPVERRVQRVRAADRERQRLHPLPDRHIRQHGVDEVGGLGRAALRAAGRAHCPRLAAERHEALEGAVCASRPEETAAQVAAPEVGDEPAPDVSGELHAAVRSAETST